MKTIRILVLTLVVALVAMSFAPVVRAQDPVKLTLTGWASSDSENTLLQQIVDTFNEANKGSIEVTLNQVPDYDTTLAKDLASSNPPDVFYVDSNRLPDLVKAGQLLPIGDKLTDAEDFYPALKDAFTYDGQFYCPPKDFSALALQINTDMFTAAGLEAPTTWEELAAAAKALTTDTVAGIVLPTDPARWLAFLYQAGGTVADDGFTKMTINSPEGLEAMKFYTDLYLNGYAKTPADLGAGWPGEAFGQGKAAMAFEGNWIYPYLTSTFPDLKFQVTELPAGKEKATLAFTVCYGTAPSSKNPEQALKLIDYLTGAEGMKAWTDLGLAMPTRQSLTEGWLSKFPDLKAFSDGAAYAHKWQFIPGWGAVNDKISEQLSLVFAGQQTPEDALAEIEKTGNDVIAKK
ncbi:MAG: ABC transporter substrate-binding protein [Anaerolineae bacterium]|nr:ABC transporter substrate-binding protein [Anaerolineae bacterium]